MSATLSVEVEALPAHNSLLRVGVMCSKLGFFVMCAPLAALAAAAAAPTSNHVALCTRTRWESRLDLDFEPFQGGITRDAVDRAECRTQGGYRVLLLNNTLHTIPLGWEAEAWSDRKSNTHPIFHLLLQALCLHRMPDVEFVINIYDRRAVIDFNDPVPILSWTKGELAVVVASWGRVM